MMVVCIKCGTHVPLSKAITEDGCQGCPVEGVQESLCRDEREDTRVTEQDSSHLHELSSQ